MWGALPCIDCSPGFRADCHMRSKKRDRSLVRASRLDLPDEPGRATCTMSRGLVPSAGAAGHASRRPTHLDRRLRRLIVGYFRIGHGLYVCGRRRFDGIGGRVRGVRRLRVAPDRRQRLVGARCTAAQRSSAEQQHMSGAAPAQKALHGLQFSVGARMRTTERVLR